MTKSYQKITWLIRSFEEEKETVFKMLNQLNDLLNDNFGVQGLGSKKGIRDIEKMVKFLKKKYFLHVKLDEGVIFPFLKKHVPRLEPVLNFLRDERNKFKASLEAFEDLHKKFIGAKELEARNEILERLKQKGIYLILLARNHIQAEDESVYKVIVSELHSEEKTELMGQLKECC